MGHALQSNDWELLGLGSYDILSLVPVGLSTPGDSEEAVLLTGKRQSWRNAGLEFSLTVTVE